MRARRVIFLDLNLIADIPYAKELFTALIPLKIQWGGLATTTIAWDDELPGYARFYSADPWGNRLEFLAELLR